MSTAERFMQLVSPINESLKNNIDQTIVGKQLLQTIRQNMNYSLDDNIPLPEEDGEFFYEVFIKPILNTYVKLIEEINACEEAGEGTPLKKIKELINNEASLIQRYVMELTRGVFISADNLSKQTYQGIPELLLKCLEVHCAISQDELVSLIHQGMRFAQASYNRPDFIPELQMSDDICILLQADVPPKALLSKKNGVKFNFDGDETPNEVMLTGLTNCFGLIARMGEKFFISHDNMVANQVGFFNSPNAKRPLQGFIEALEESLKGNPSYSADKPLEIDIVLVQKKELYPVYSIEGLADYFSNEELIKHGAPFRYSSVRIIQPNVCDSSFEPEKFCLLYDISANELELVTDCPSTPLLVVDMTKNCRRFSDVLPSNQAAACVERPVSQAQALAELGVFREVPSEEEHSRASIAVAPST